jgi:formylglycine-generating enzyme required for sulfatase activity
MLLTTSCDSRRAIHVAPEWRDISAGKFTMGTPVDEKCREAGEFKETAHQVTLTHDFEMSVTETTQDQFLYEKGYNFSEFVGCGGDCPAEKVSWYEAASYCNALSAQAGYAQCYVCSGNYDEVECELATKYSGKAIYECPGYRLPTEAEWEYACRAGTTTAYYSGIAISCTGWDDHAQQIGWYSTNAGAVTHTVGMKTANAWGLKDMSGNVWEWVHDRFANDLGSASVTDPVGPDTAYGRGLRGGSAEVPAQLLRSGARYNYGVPDENLRFQGFRCVRTTSF